MKVLMMDKQDMIHEGYTPTENVCPHCEEGTLWSNSYETVCQKCDITWRKEDVKKKKDLTKIKFYEERPTYSDGRIIPQGGFVQAYEDYKPNESSISN
jgi:hypothetical protein